METEVSIAKDVPEYPKIETLWDRNPENFKVMPGAFRCPEFAAVNRWHVTEKINGTNVRIALRPDGTIFYGGRTDAAQIPPRLLAVMRRDFPIDRMRAVFRKDDNTNLVVLYGEGYGPTIQKGGGNYRADIAVRLFDILIAGVWLTQESVAALANELGVLTAPVIGLPMTTEQAVEHLGHQSIVADSEGGRSIPQEGIIARSDPLMLDRMGRRIVWKLKAKDF